MSWKITSIVLFSVLLLFGVGLFYNQFLDYELVYLQAVSNNNNPLTSAQVNEVRSWISKFWSYWNNGEDVIEELDNDTPRSIIDYFRNRLKGIASMLDGCFALPNDRRPGGENLRSMIEKWVDRLDAAATQDDSDDEDSSNPEDYNLEGEIDRVEAEIKALLAAWCNEGQSASEREFCPCVYNCDGADNTGKSWNAQSYDCNPTCPESNDDELCFICNTQICACEENTCYGVIHNRRRD